MSDVSVEKIERCMIQELEAVGEETSAVIAARRMSSRRIGCLVVHANDPELPAPNIVGLISETDLVRKVMAQGHSASETTAAQIMASPLLTISQDRGMIDASHFMEQHGVRHLCVSNGEQIVGLISIRDIVKHFVYAKSGPIRDLDDVYRPLSVLMKKAIEKIDRDETVLAAAQQLTNKRIGALLVTEGSEEKGIVTERDLVQKVLARGQDPGQIQVGTVMTVPLINIDINRTVHDASDLMAEKGIRHLPVIENHKIVGILSVRDLIKMIAARDRPRFLRQNKGAKG
jgi:signal-transduction protein with cAMP-binding, CBS, and nucleotidyltransferase domain